ncbi:MAG TPA: M20 family metallo-hydrolase, partial [bacterium]|nr:M20 family metallo-hydrolase [bacterium]
MAGIHLQDVLSRIDSYRSDVISIQQALTRVPALAPEFGGQGENDKSKIIGNYLTDLRPDAFEQIRIPDSRVSCGYRPNLLARWKGRSSQHTIWIMSHMDVVPAGEDASWQTPPFEAVEKDGRIYGRGTEDNQQGIVSSLLAVRALRELDLAPTYDVGLALVADEENGSQYGISAILDTRRDMFTKDDLIVIPDAGDPGGILIEVAEKSILWIRCETVGKQTHGSTPEKGINAHKAAARLIVKMDELYALYPKKDPLYDPPVSTFEPTRKEPNVGSINIIPGHDVFCFDCRILPDYDPDAVVSRIRVWADEIERQFGVRISLTFPQSVP